jgi:alpha-aminoadipic semialdehyde synthase
MRVFRHLPTVSIAPDQLLDFFKGGHYSNGTLYTVHFRQRDLFEPRDRDLEFDWSRLHRHPEDYVNRFEGFVPYLSMLVNGIYWETRFPRLVTKSYMRSHYERNPNPRLRVIADITCDVEGSIELTTKTTESGEGSVYVYEPLKDRVTDGVDGNGPVILAIDTLPSELPREASTAFGDALMPFVPTLAGADFAVEHDEDLVVPPEIKKAVIVHRGSLTRRYEYLSDSLSKAS